MDLFCLKGCLFVFSNNSCTTFKEGELVQYHKPDGEQDIVFHNNS